jgi:hypothetical protein
MGKAFPKQLNFLAEQVIGVFGSAVPDRCNQTPQQHWEAPKVADYPFCSSGNSPHSIGLVEDVFKWPDHVHLLLCRSDSNVDLFGGWTILRSNTSIWHIVFWACRLRKTARASKSQTQEGVRDHKHCFSLLGQYRLSCTCNITFVLFTVRRAYRIGLRKKIRSFQSFPSGLENIASRHASLTARILDQESGVLLSIIRVCTLSASVCQSHTRGHG